MHLGLSGGVDSAVVATLACKALGETKVPPIFSPWPFYFQSFQAMRP